MRPTRPSRRSRPARRRRPGKSSRSPLRKVEPMPNIHESVGTHGRNAVHDVAMVQFMTFGGQEGLVSDFSIETFLGRPTPAATKASDPKPADLKPFDITPSDFKAVAAMLKAEFQAAADNWKAWQPVKYPNADRRKPNPVKH